MKKIIALLMAAVLTLSMFAFVSCAAKDDDSNAATTAEASSEKVETLKLGLGLTTSVSTTDATAATDTEKAVDGAGQVTTTAAAVLVDKDGKIVKAFIDCSDNKAAYTADGKAVAAEFKTKYEMGKDYNMVLYGGAAKEWYEQADAFCALIVGKTAEEVKALVAADYKGTSDVINAGCTIYVSDFATAVENAIKNATDSGATKNDTLKLGVSTSQTVTDATADAAGTNELETTFFAAAIDANGKVVAASSDCVQAKFTFDATGKSTFDASKKVLSKKQQGDNYGMVAYGGAKAEWYKQAAAFDAACVGKTVKEIASLMGADYKGVADLQTAGCTVYVSGFVKAASKLG